jgi:hypothetical protein
MTSDQKYYQHKYGGIYVYRDTVINKSNNDEEMILYEHVYPFNKKFYVKKKQEFNESNKLLSSEELDLLLSKSKDDFQKEITEKKNQNRKNKERRDLSISDLGYII